MKDLVISKNILNERSSILKDFFKDADKYPIYSSEEQIEFARQALKGDEKAREKLITSNLKFVVTCAKKYVGQGVSLLDLIQAGMLGLCQAIDNYDPDRGYKFLSFAVWYIRREILREIYNTGRTIRYPITYIGKITKVKKAYEKFVNEHGREPSHEELIDLANVTKKQYNSVLMNKSYCQSFETPINDEGNKLEDVLSEQNNEFSDTFTKESISRVLNTLNPREYEIITKYYGLEGVPQSAVKDIASDLNLTTERIRQIKKIALKKMKTRYGNTLKTLL